jgi:hypothetical protein
VRGSKGRIVRNGVPHLSKALEILKEACRLAFVAIAKFTTRKLLEANVCIPAMTALRNTCVPYATVAERTIRQDSALRFGRRWMTTNYFTLVRRR